MHVLELWGEARGNPHGQKDDMQTPHRKAPAGRFKPRSSHCDATLLTTTPLCCVDNNLLPNKIATRIYRSTQDSAALRYLHMCLVSLIWHYISPPFSFFPCPCASLLHFLSFTGRFQLNVAWICLNFSKVLKSHQSCEAWVKWDCHLKKAGITLLCFDTALVSSADIVMHRDTQRENTRTQKQIFLCAEVWEDKHYAASVSLW